MCALTLALRTGIDRYILWFIKCRGNKLESQEFIRQLISFLGLKGQDLISLFDGSSTEVKDNKKAAMPRRCGITLYI